MLIQSAGFLLFFVVVSGFNWLFPARLRWVPLLGASLFFVGYGHPTHLVFLLLATTVAYVVAVRLAGLPPSAGPSRRRWMVLGVVVLLGALAGAKYLGFLLETVSGIAGLFGTPLGLRPLQVLLPIGISFYTFRLLGYLLDVYHGRLAVERHPGYFGLFAAFFPQVSAGPIERAGQFLPRLRAPQPFDLDRMLSGAAQVAWGVFKKAVIANRLALFVDQAFASPHGQGLNLIFAAWFYAVQIYCDFSGYTDVAIGLSRLLGYESAKNFDAPYASPSIAEFWNRWHISLSSWFRDYLFLPVSYVVMRRYSGDRFLGVRVETLAYAEATIITMFLCGLWHGPSWSFVVWGLLHGLYLIVGQVGHKRRRRWAKRSGLLAHPWLHRALRVTLTFNLVSFAWIFFRAPTLAQAFEYLHYVQIKPPTSGLGHLLVDTVLAGGFLAAEALRRGARPLPLALPVRAALLAVVVCLVLLFGVDSANEFIYVRF